MSQVQTAARSTTHGSVSTRSAYGYHERVRGVGTQAPATHIHALTVHRAKSPIEIPQRKPVVRKGSSKPRRLFMVAALGLGAKFGWSYLPIHDTGLAVGDCVSIVATDAKAVATDQDCLLAHSAEIYAVGVLPSHIVSFDQTQAKVVMSSTCSAAITAANASRAGTAALTFTTLYTDAGYSRATRREYWCAASSQDGALLPPGFSFPTA